MKRPWVGRVLKTLAGDEFLVQWYMRKGKKNLFHACVNSDGSPDTAVLSHDMLMFWDMSENKLEKSFTLSNYLLTAIEAEYGEIDRREKL